MTQQEIAAVLRTWYLIELMSPQAVKFEDRKRGKDLTHQRIRKDTEIAWEQLGQKQQQLFADKFPDEGEAQKRSDRSSKPEAKYIVYLGISKLSGFDAALAQAADLKLTALDVEHQNKDDCAWASIQLDKAGIYIQESLTVSTVPWVLMQLAGATLAQFVEKPQPKSFQHFVQNVEHDLPFEPNVPVTANLLIEAANLVRERCGLTIDFQEEAHLAIYDHPTREHRDILNSFFYEDIAEALDDNSRNSLAPLVAQLFRRLDDSQREEVLKNPRNLRILFEKGGGTCGAWPNVKLDPVLMQEAVVEATHLDKESRIVAVNGPPGTGKTTLLRAVIADRIIERARAIAERPEPPERCGSYYRLPRHLTGFEIVVASANNGAIENISNELPLVQSIAGFEEQLLNDGGYFHPVAQFVADWENLERSTVRWGLIAASLGNKTKRDDFIGPFLFEPPAETAHPALHNLQTFHETPVESLDHATAAFLQALHRVNQLSERPDWSQWSTIADKHSTAPGSSAELVDAKRKAFIAALRLHRSYIGTHWNHGFLSNLKEWAKVVRKGWEFEERHALALWQTFFLVVPVISTTFASVRRMLPKVHGLGWAVIDEAGQATPQAAIGLLSRTKKAVIVGDPLQLEPVVTLSSTIIRGLRRTLSVDESWTAANDTDTSLQTVAEKTVPWGTYRTLEEQKHWFGIPLVIHRRCDEPMFGIINDVVYDNDMTSMTRKDYPTDIYPYGESCWVAETSSVSGKHAVREQLELVAAAILKMTGFYVQSKLRLHREHATERNLDELLERWQAPDIRVITPFREIEHEFVETFKALAPPKERSHWVTWCDKNIGTVHKAQGKEANMVFCVLGLDANTAGAADFATMKPNFMNVAVSRAKHRLYVVGNPSLWGNRNYFRQVYQAFRRGNNVVTPAEFQARFDQAALGDAAIGELPPAS